ncbi:MAG: RdgB/HAM1 family non-canonical purine NTP pyrophosphatase [Alphaproteobacteria bacterium]|nr:RdgB/HAM1 family non-canonical purine NTP pyrophosphatase [Alphaproteobacteria bacterium]
MRLFQEPKLLIASHNSGKIREIADLLGPLQIITTSSAALNLEEPEETGSTFMENALLKAQAGMNVTGLPCLADDSGLAVTALEGQPGIYSGRWAQLPDGTRDFSYAINRINQDLTDKSDLSAHFVCALSLVWPDGSDVTLEGKVYGHLTFPPRGKKGFGYDPIFIPEGHSITYAEMAPELKQRISHRAIAIQKMIHACFTPHA